MGILDRIKRATYGPNVVERDGPYSFSWTDGTLAVPCTLTNGTDQAQEVVEVRAKLSAASAREGGAKFAYRATLSEPFPLAPGERASRTLTIGLRADTSSSGLQAAAEGSGLPAVPDVWTSALSGLVGAAPQHRGAHELSVVVKVSGSTRLSSGRAKVDAL